MIPHTEHQWQRVWWDWRRVITWPDDGSPYRRLEVYRCIVPGCDAVGYPNE